MRHLLRLSARASVIGLLAAITGTGCGAEQPRAPSILLVTLDTTRADHLSCYGYERPTSPSIDRLAADGLRYTHAYAVTSWTLPSHASLFTGKFPSAHGAQYDPDGPLNLIQGIRGRPEWDQYKARPLAADEVTLAQRLGEHGYVTGAVIAGPWLKAVFGLDKGFEFYSDENFTSHETLHELNGRPAEDVTRVAIEFVERHADRPFFLFLNYYDPHRPHVAQQPHSSDFEEEFGPLHADYDSEIRYMDEQFGRLLLHLQARGLYEDMWIIVTADHGELLGENGLMGHGKSLSQAEIRIPLIVKRPGSDRPRGVNATPVQQPDVMPMLLHALGLPSPPDMQGQPFDRITHPIVAEVYPPQGVGGAEENWRQRGDWRVLIQAPYKFAWNSLGQHALYDLSRDPDETTNTLSERPELAVDFERRLQDFLESLPEPGALGAVEPVDAETLELLKSFGYVGDDG